MDRRILTGMVAAAAIGMASIALAASSQWSGASGSNTGFGVNTSGPHKTDENPGGEINVWIPAGGYINGEIITGARVLRTQNRVGSVPTAITRTVVFVVDAYSPTEGVGGKPHTFGVAVHFSADTREGVMGTTYEVSTGGVPLDNDDPTPFLPNPAP